MEKTAWEDIEIRSGDGPLFFEEDEGFKRARDMGKFISFGVSN